MIKNDIGNKENCLKYLKQTNLPINNALPKIQKIQN
jgi:hypothetical protein